MNAMRPYEQKLPLTWWLRHPNYVRYMLRELTCVWIGAYIATLVVGLYRLRQGPEQWQAWWQALGSIPGIVFQVMAMIFALYHTISWFALAPSTMPIWRGENQVPEGWVHAAHYLVWVVVSIFVIWIAGV